MKKYIYIFLVLIIFSFTFNFNHNNKVVNKSLFESTTTVAFNELIEKLDTFHYNLINADSFIVDTDNFLCTGTNISCQSSMYSKVGLINLDEYNSVGGKSSYINAKNNYWTMTEEGSAAHIITSIGSALVPKESYIGVRPAVYLKNSLKVSGSGMKNDPYVFSSPINYYIDGTGANYPELASNMIPIKRNGDKWVKADVEKKWYNYASQEWANAVLVKETGTNTRSYYLSRAAIDQEVKEEDILAYFVWIPRYAYKIATCYHSNCNGEGGVVSVKFLSGNTNNTNDATEVFEDNASNVHYVKHPAFNFGGSELNGIWVAKFETTGTIGTACTNENCATASLTSKPNVTSLRNVTISNMFFATRSMERNGNEYGLISSNVDTHVMKSNELGAFAYLVQSQYGKYGNSLYVGINKEVWKNPSSDFITGCAGTTLSPSASSGCSYSYNTSNGMQASSTGNIYGIYDISGNSYEFTMGFLTGSSLASSGFSSLPDSKYYNAYSAYNNSIYGDSIYETSSSINSPYINSWFNDYARFIDSTSPWRVGSGAYNNNYAGIFYFSASSGAASNEASSRISITLE